MPLPGRLESTYGLLDRRSRVKELLGLDGKADGTGPACKPEKERDHTQGQPGQRAETEAH